MEVKDNNTEKVQKMIQHYLVSGQIQISAKEIPSLNISHNGLLHLALIVKDEASG